MRIDVPTGRSCYVSALREELIARNNSYAVLNLLPHVTSYGELPVVVYEQSECGRHHGNFIAASYRAILRRPEWRKRLQKVHSQGRRSLPAKDSSWRELDSSLSSDALLMNVFCYPGVTRRRELCGMLGLEPGSVSEFGFMPRIPLLSEAMERTEIDMKLGNTLFEAKLTEGDFQIQRAELVERYRDLREVFEPRQLPRTKRNTSRISSFAMCSRLMRSTSISARCSTLAGRTCSRTGTALRAAYDLRLFALDARC